MTEHRKRLETAKDGDDRAIDARSGRRVPNPRAHGKASYPLAVIQDGYQLFDARITDLVALAREEGRSIPCRRGCSACCYDMPLVTQYDMPPLVEHLRAMSPEQKASVRAAIISWCGSMASKGIPVDDAEPDMKRFHAHPKTPCPLLDVARGECTAYEGRPPACRGHILVDEEPTVCATREHHPEIQCLDVSDEISRLVAFTIRHSVGRARDVPLLILMLPAMLLRAWTLVERPELSYADWFESIEVRANARRRV